MSFSIVWFPFIAFSFSHSHQPRRQRFVFRLFVRFCGYFHFSLNCSFHRPSIFVSARNEQKRAINISKEYNRNNNNRLHINYAPQIVNGNDFSLTLFVCEGEKSAFFPVAYWPRVSMVLVFGSTFSLVCVFNFILSVLFIYLFVCLPFFVPAVCIVRFKTRATTRRGVHFRSVSLSKHHSCFRWVRLFLCLFVCAEMRAYSNLMYLDCVLILVVLF